MIPEDWLVPVLKLFRMVVNAESSQLAAWVLLSVGVVGVDWERMSEVWEERRRVPRVR